jgi:hypothetical protein
MEWAWQECAPRLGIFAAGFYLLVGLLTGVWKYLQMSSSAEAQAHPYVDIAHRAALMYSFASLVIAVLAALSTLPSMVNLIATAAPLLFFGLAIASYVLHGILADTDNQLRAPHVMGTRRVSALSIHGFMVALILAEIGGVLVLFIGALPQLI